ncbi:ComEC/Rec2 family competence protein [Campylobacter jejuni]|uniref:ComEC/Rec2 family competence protein n=1 Tax=Campylobacter jejuni TaxID=197 RepID=UPI000F8077CB|nr:ComEC/Rec2 family competence protein [Campylobacter jejuni]ECR3131602.1 ComEC/Rec2 family competence protein [Campylobacter jejuni]EDP6005000.1 ComEC/Rec2 family competence protein [Campylobacter jejuni]ELH9167346.1 ComEC/Rec2 family competence protein [Campylobacter jejuni]RTI97907.1 competence protein [Campylobacter jejuni]RTJ70882.1 competence protein [Campylobacter jejuni]
MSLWNSFSYSFKEFHYLFLSVVIIFIFNILLEYNNFLKFKNQKHYFINNALLTHQYTKYNKKNKKYWVLKLQTENFTFYTTSFKDLNLSKNQLLSLRIITHNINFKDYLSKSFYAPSYDFQKLKEKEYNPIISYFLNQHTNEKIKEFYGALFFALPISLELRNDVNYYGIAHLIAISGYHIGLLFSLIFFILAPIYSFFQKRYFPYRNLRLDLSILIFTLLLAYACLIGFVPSFVRSLIMAFWVFYLLCKNIKIINFFTLFCSILLCISLYPRLLFSIGFLFSILGVFYIFLYMHHFANKFNNLINIILLNIWTFFAMILPVLYFFPLISYQQILGIILSGIFVIFYPLVLFLHLINYGDLFNFILDEFFKFKIYGTNIHIPFWIFISYLIVSLISVRFKYLAFLCIFANFIPFIMIVI